jgi:PilZ domain
MSSTRYNYRPIDGRRDQRYPSPELKVGLVFGEFVTTNWSLGGLLLSDFRDRVALGTILAGTLSTGQDIEPVPFEAEVVRCDRATGELALKFVDLSERGVDVLDRALARRFFRRRR